VALSPVVPRSCEMIIGRLRAGDVKSSWAAPPEPHGTTSHVAPPMQDFGLGRSWNYLVGSRP
jgi:hypothetical protein